MFCDVDTDAVFQALTAKSIYEVPLLLQEQGMDKVVLKKLNMEDRPCEHEGMEGHGRQDHGPHKDKTKSAS